MKETLAFILPCVTIALSLGASAVYGYCGDWRRCIYWFAGSLITASMTAPDSWFK
jgi:hypothetical protein